MSIYQIAIDGPAGSGKSTLAKILSSKLGIMYLDTGAMYRTVALATIIKGISSTDKNKIIELMADIKLEVRFIDNNQHMFLYGEDVTSRLRTPEVSMAASTTSAIREVREKLVSIQREIAMKESFVLDGRDIGSKVLPDARYKFFLTATPEVRASRRLLEMREKGISSQTFEEVLEDIVKRDLQDTTREESPLIKVEDAIEIDTSDISIDDMVNLILRNIDE